MIVQVFWLHCISYDTRVLGLEPLRSLTKKVFGQCRSLIFVQNDHFCYSVMLRRDDLVGLADCPLSIQYHTIHYFAKAGGFRLVYHSGNLELATCYLQLPACISLKVWMILDLRSSHPHWKRNNTVIGFNDRLWAYFTQRPTHENFYLMMARSSSQQNDGRKEWRCIMNQLHTTHKDCNPNNG
jgi:hypothetical protein